MACWWLTLQLSVRKPIQSWQANGTVRVEVISGNIVVPRRQFTAMLPAGSTGRAPSRATDAAAINLDTGALLPWNPNVTGGTVYASAAGSNVYLGGAFTTVGGATNHKKIVEVDNVNGAIVSGFKPPTPNKTVRGITGRGSNLYIGGAFTDDGRREPANAAKARRPAAPDSNWRPWSTPRCARSPSTRAATGSSWAGSSAT